MTNTTKIKKYRDFKLEQLLPTLKHYGIVTSTGLDSCAVQHLKRLYVELTVEVVSDIYKATRKNYNLMELSMLTKQPTAVIEDIANGNFDKDTFIVNSAYYSKTELCRLLNVSTVCMVKYDYPVNTLWLKGSDFITMLNNSDETYEMCSSIKAIEKYDFLNTVMLRSLIEGIVKEGDNIVIYDTNIRTKKTGTGTYLDISDLDKAKKHIANNYMLSSEVLFWKDLTNNQKIHIKEKIYMDIGVKVNMGRTMYVNKSKVNLFKNMAIELGYIENELKAA
jgi:hypothetical protein